MVIEKHKIENFNAICVLKFDWFEIIKTQAFSQLNSNTI
jgi:hypothetical protein